MRILGPLRRRQLQRQQLNAPDLSRARVVDDDLPPLPDPRTDWPVIQTRHPGWWQVHRIEVYRDGAMRHVLIAECRTEAQAFAVAAQQASQVRITKWGSKERPYTSHREPRVIEP